MASYILLRHWDKTSATVTRWTQSLRVQNQALPMFFVVFCGRNLVMSQIGIVIIIIVVVVVVVVVVIAAVLLLFIPAIRQHSLVKSIAIENNG